MGLSCLSAPETSAGPRVAHFLDPQFFSRTQLIIASYDNSFEAEPKRVWRFGFRADRIQAALANVRQTFHY
jgi:hypothetical protein